MPPTLIADRYEILRPLGAGGSADVYVAKDRAYDREVALKVLKPEIGASVARERFRREIAVLARLEHPDILPLYDAGEHEGLPFFVTRLADGGTLRDRLRRQPQLALDEAMAIVAAVGGALDHAHAQGIVHRDIKPENILFHHGRVVVGDFGIARALDLAGADRVTDSQYAVGTPVYMSPEQALGGGPLDAATDVYALGVVAYELLAGAPPFDGPTPHAILARKAHDPVPPLRTVRATVPEHVERAITRALAVTPADRFRTCGNFVAALRTAGNGDGAARAGTSKRKTRTALAASVAVVLLGTAAVMWSRLPSGTPPVSPALLPRVLVTEFANEAGRADLAFVGIAAVDWLTEGLHRTGLVAGVPTEHAVRASRSIVASERPRNWLQQLGRETSASLVVTGRYYRSGDSVLFQLQVIDPTDGGLVGAIGPVPAPAEDPLQGLAPLRAQLLGLLAPRIDPRLAGFAERDEVPHDFAAYRAFGTGVERYVAGDFAAAIPAFDEAFARDSTFAEALLFGSIGRSNLGRFAEADSLLGLLASRRDELSDHDRAWLDFRRAFLDGRRLDALRAVRELARLTPGTKASYNHALEAMENGYVEEARQVLVAGSPDAAALRGWLPYFEVLGATQHLLGQFEAELATARNAARRHPARRYARIAEVRAHAALGRLADLERAIAAADSLPPDPFGTTTVRLLAEAADEVEAHLGVATAEPWRRRLDAAIVADDPAGTRRDLLRLRAANARALGDRALALRTSAALIAVDATDAEHIAARGAALAIAGQPTEAAAFAAQLAGDGGRFDFGGRHRARARVEVALGLHDAAVESLAAAFSRGREYNLWVHRDPDFRALREHGDFVALARPKR